MNVSGIVSHQKCFLFVSFTVNRLIGTVPALPQNEKGFVGFVQLNLNCEDGRSNLQRGARNMEEKSCRGFLLPYNCSVRTKDTP